MTTPVAGSVVAAGSGVLNALVPSVTRSPAGRPVRRSTAVTVTSTLAGVAPLKQPSRSDADTARPSADSDGRGQ
ncbi:MAG: hypothetical protein ACXVXC_13195 [Nocardioidaceae bacterium]